MPGNAGPRPATSGAHPWRRAPANESTASRGGRAWVTSASPVTSNIGTTMSNQLGESFEGRAQTLLERRGWRLVARNYRCRGGEIDLIMRDRAGVLVFVEVRARSRSDFGGAAESITRTKRRRLALAARHYLLRRPAARCRFDVVAFDGHPPVACWLPDAFRTDDF
ncbi:YraN family protein [Pandoraea communis]